MVTWGREDRGWGCAFVCITHCANAVQEEDSSMYTERDEPRIYISPTPNWFRHPPKHVSDERIEREKQRYADLVILQAAMAPPPPSVMSTTTGPAGARLPTATGPRSLVAADAQPLDESGDSALDPAATSGDGLAESPRAPEHVLEFMANPADPARLSAPVPVPARPTALFPDAPSGVPTSLAAQASIFSDPAMVTGGAGCSTLVAASAWRLAGLGDATGSTSAAMRTPSRNKTELDLAAAAMDGVSPLDDGAEMMTVNSEDAMQGSELMLTARLDEDLAASFDPSKCRTCQIHYDDDNNDMLTCNSCRMVFHALCEQLPINWNPTYAFCSIFCFETFQVRVQAMVWPVALCHSFSHTLDFIFSPSLAFPAHPHTYIHTYTHTRKHFASPTIWGSLSLSFLCLCPCFSLSLSRSPAFSRSHSVTRTFACCVFPRRARKQAVTSSATTTC